MDAGNVGSEAKAYGAHEEALPLASRLVGWFSGRTFFVFVVVGADTHASGHDMVSERSKTPSTT